MVVAVLLCHVLRFIEGELHDLCPEDLFPDFDEYFASFLRGGSWYISHPNW